MAVIRILYGGDDITADVQYSTARFVSAVGGLPGSCELRVRDKTHAYAPGYFHVGGEIQLEIDGSIEWDGWAMMVSREYAFPVDDTTNPQATPRWWVIEGADRNLLFTRAYVFDQATPNNLDIGDYPAGTSDQSVVLDLLANYLDTSGHDLDLTSGITSVGPIDPWQKLNVFETAMPWQRSMQVIGALNGAIFFIDPDRVVRYVDDVTVTAPFALSDQPIDEDEVGYREMVAREQGHEMVNEIHVRGAGLGGREAVFARALSEESISLHGLFQKADVYTGMYEQLSVDRRADVWVNGSPSHRRGHKDPLFSAEVTLFEPGLRVGQVVEFRSATFDLGMFDDALVDDVPDPPDPPPTGGALFDAFVARIKQIESGGSYTAQNSRTGAYGAYQIMPKNWVVWGPKWLNTDPDDAFASSSTNGATWSPSTSQANQDTVGISQLNKLRRILGDLRRVACAWRSGGSVATRQPSTWSRGTIKYVNSACVPLGFPVTTSATVLPPVGTGGEATEDEIRDVWMPVRSYDAVYPIRKIEMSFPTPTSVRYTVLISDHYDTPWAFQDPLPDWVWMTETFVLDLPWVPPPPSVVQDPAVWPDDEAQSLTGVLRVNALSQEGGVFPAPPLFTIGSSATYDDFIVWYQSECISLGAGLGAHSGEGWREAEACYELTANVGQGVFIPEIPIQVSGYFPGVSIGILRQDPEPGVLRTATSIGSWSCPKPDPGSEVTIPPSELGSGAAGQMLGYGEMRDEYVIPGFYVGAEHFIGDAPTWLVLSPIWSATIDEGGQWCDSSYFPGQFPSYCDGRGPRCTGEADSGYAFVTSIEYIRQVLNIPESDQLTFSYDYTGSQSGLHWIQLGAFQTQYPYSPGTLEIWIGGQRLVRGVDYEETDPATGVFTILSDDQDLSLEITVRYMRWSSDPAIPQWGNGPSPGPYGDPPPTYPGGTGNYVYRPTPQRQGGWGTVYDWSNCNMTASAMALDRHTLGRYGPYTGSPRSTPPNHRYYSGSTSRLGTSMPDAVRAWSRGWNQTLLWTGPVTWAYFQHHINSGRGAIAWGKYSAMTGGYRKSSFAGTHAIYINEQFADGSFWGVDPLYKYPLVYPASVLFDYMTALSGSGIVASFTRATGLV